MSYTLTFDSLEDLVNLRDILMEAHERQHPPYRWNSPPSPTFLAWLESLVEQIDKQRDISPTE